MEGRGSMRCPLDGGGKPPSFPDCSRDTDQYRLSAAPGYSVPTWAVRRPRATLLRSVDGREVLHS